MIFHLTPRISAGYGELDPVHLTPHNGIDVAVPIGTKLYTPDDGIVSKIVDYGNDSLGKAIFVKTKAGYQYIFGHLSEVKVHVGEQLRSGEILGLSGNSGYSTGPHVHIGALNVLGEFTDPGVPGHIGISLINKVIEGPFNSNHVGFVKKIFEFGSKESITEDVTRTLAYKIGVGIVKGLGDLIVDFSYSIALIGTGLCIILYVAGWTKGKQWAGILTVAWVLIRYLIGAPKNM